MKINNQSGKAVAEAIDKRIIEVARRAYQTVPNDKSEIGIVVSTNSASKRYNVRIKKKTYSAFALKSALPISVNDQVLCIVLNGQYSQICIIGVIAS